MTAFMLALFSRFLRWLRPDGVRALKPVALLDLFSRPSGDLWTHEFFTWPNGTKFEVSGGVLRVWDVALGGAGCDWMITIQSANAGELQPVETGLKSAKNKESEKSL
jgi:hypothetical protein